MITAAPPRQFDVVTQEVPMAGVRRFKNSVVLHPANRQAIEDIAAVIIDHNAIHLDAGIVWVFFWDDPANADRTGADIAICWIRDNLPRQVLPPKGHEGMTAVPYRDGTLYMTVHREIGAGKEAA